VTPQPFDEEAKLPRAEERGSSATEVDESKPSGSNGRKRAVEFHFPCQSLDVGFHLARVLIRVNPEIAELALLSAKGKVEIESQRRIGLRRPVQRFVDLGKVRVLPK